MKRKLLAQCAGTQASYNRRGVCSPCSFDSAAASIPRPTLPQCEYRLVAWRRQRSSSFIYVKGNDPCFISLFLSSRLGNTNRLRICRWVILQYSQATEVLSWNWREYTFARRSYLSSNKTSGTAWHRGPPSKTHRLNATRSKSEPLELDCVCIFLKQRVHAEDFLR